MKKIYVLLMNTKTIPSRLIKFLTHYEYSHVGLALDYNCDTIYSFGRKKVNSIIGGGFSIENRDGAFFHKFDKTKCLIYEIEITDKQYRKIIKIINKMKNNIDIYKYDYLGIIMRYLKIPITFKNKYVCSYFVAYILKEAGVCNFKRVCMVKPEDFTKIDKLNVIYQGLYNLYNC